MVLVGTRVIPLLFFSFFSLISFANEDGVYYYNLNGSIDSVPYLKKEAHKNDPISQRLLAYELRKARGLTKESMKWFLKSARQGDLYSMISLGNSEVCRLAKECSPENGSWFRYFENTAKSRSDNGDNNAMRALSYYYELIGDEKLKNKWLEKAAEFGNARAQLDLALDIDSGKGFYWTDEERDKDAEKWYVKSSGNGFYPAKLAYSKFLFRKGRYSEGEKVIYNAAEDGYYPAIEEIASCKINKGISDRKKMCGNIKIDIPEGWGEVLYLNDFGLYSRYRKLVIDELSYSDRKEGQKIYEKIKSTHSKPFGQRVVY